MTVVRRFLLPVALLGLCWPLLSGDARPQKDDKDKLPEVVSYYRHVRPLFLQHCQGCHQPAKAEGSFLMTTYDELFKQGESDKPGVVAGQPDRSYIVEQITPHDGKSPKMPRNKEPLSAHEVNLIKKWIAQGARNDTPPSARQIVVDADHPPVYHLAPVLTSVAFSPDSKLLAVSGYHEVLLHHADGTGLVARLIGASERIQSVAFSPDGKYLAVAGGSPGRFGEIQVWNVARKQLKLSVPMTFDTVYGVSWSPDGTKIAFGCADKSLRAIDLTGKQILYQGGHDDWVLETVFSKDGSHLVSVSRDMSMKLTEVATQRLVDNITSITPGALKGGLITVDRHPTKDELVIGGADGLPKLYQMYRTKPRQIGDDFNRITSFRPAALPGRVFSVRFNKDGSRVVCGSSKDGTGEARVLQVSDGKLIAKLDGELGPVYAVAFRPDGQLVASAGFAGVVRLHDPNTGKLVREFVPVPLTPAKAIGAK